MDVGSLVTSNPQLLAAALFLSGGMLLLNGIGQAVSIWDRTRRKPPLDQELQYYAKKSDLAQVEQRMRDELASATLRHEKVMEKHADDQNRVIDNIFSKVGGLERSVQASLKEIMHELGKLSGRIEK